MKALHRYRFDSLENLDRYGLLIRDSLPADQLRKWYWEERRSVPEISKISEVPSQTLYELMRKYQIPRRNWSKSNYLVNTMTSDCFNKSSPGFRKKPTN